MVIIRNDLPLNTNKINQFSCLTDNWHKIWHSKQCLTQDFAQTELPYVLIIKILCNKWWEMSLQQRDETSLFVNYFLCISRATSLQYHHIISIMIQRNIKISHCSIICILQTFFVHSCVKVNSTNKIYKKSKVEVLIRATEVNKRVIIWVIYANVDLTHHQS